MKTTPNTAASLIYRAHQFLLAQQARFNHYIHEIYCRQAAHWRNDTTGSDAPACNCEVGRLIEELERTLLTCSPVHPTAGQ